MTAYGAVISLTKTINHIRQSSHYNLVEPSQQILQFLSRVVSPWLGILVRLDSTSPSRSRKKVNALDARIKETLWEFQDLLESHILSQQILPQPQNPPDRVGAGAGERDVFAFSIDMLHLLQHVGPFIRTLRDLEKEYIHELEKTSEDNEEEDEEDESISTRISTDSSGTMIGLREVYDRVKSELMLTKEHPTKHVHVLVGMGGIGKTTLANQIFRDPQIMSHFECRAWVGVGRVPELGQASRDLVAQLCEHSTMMKQRLTGKKCLVVVDDVWETEVLDSLICSLPITFNGSIQFLVTTRDRMVIANIAAGIASDSFTTMRFLADEESKDLLCHKMFGDRDFCPPQLDQAATKIAKNCEGFPLTIAKVAEILSVNPQNREPEYWNDVAMHGSSVFTDAYNEVTKVLFPSYDYLPQHLKMPFLYLGVFPQDYKTPISKIINMLTVEGWLAENVWQCLQELCFYKHLALSHRHSIYCYHSLMFKTCFVHPLWKPVYREETRKYKFFHVLNSLVDAENGVIKGQRCLCLQNNILFAIKKVSNSVRSSCASSIRSVLFWGPYHKYPIPIDVGFKLLWKLDALNLRFYIFPIEILKLAFLEYLALTCNGELPATLSKLFNLRVLIIHPHVDVRHCRGPSYVPIQIWDMKELERIEILGKSLVAPNHDASLEKLRILVGVNASISTILELSRRIPNIKKLGVRIELTPIDDHSELFSCFGCISTSLESLEALKCSIINPAIKYAYPPSSLMLPGGLKKLHLSGTGFPWEYMDDIGSLPLLRVLKLRSYAFGGLQWEAEIGSFPSLEFLQVEDTDLMCLNLRYGTFPKLTNLSLKHCYKLETLLWPSSSTQRMIELVDCNPLASDSAKEIQRSAPNTLINFVTSHDLCLSCFHGMGTR